MVPKPKFFFFYFVSNNSTEPIFCKKNYKEKLGTEPNLPEHMSFIDFGLFEALDRFWGWKSGQIPTERGQVYWYICPVKFGWLKVTLKRLPKKFWSNHWKIFKKKSLLENFGLKNPKMTPRDPRFMPKTYRWYGTGV